MSQEKVNQPKPMTVPRFVNMKQKGQKIAMLTAYDYPMARLLEEAGADVLLVGDSLAMVVQGQKSTLPVTLDEMIYHAKMVTRGAERAMVVVDIPFPINHYGIRDTILAAGRILKETGCQAVKLEGGSEQAEVISALVKAGIPVMAHVGLRPQAVHVMGGYRVQRDREVILKDAIAAQEAGAFGVVLECIPKMIARDLTAELSIPTIGIGAGPDCDGQVLVLHDMLGIQTGYVPGFVKQYADVGAIIKKGVADYCNEVRQGNFPNDEHSFLE